MGKKVFRNPQKNMTDADKAHLPRARLQQWLLLQWKQRDDLELGCSSMPVRASYSQCSIRQDLAAEYLLSTRVCMSILNVCQCVCVCVYLYMRVLATHNAKQDKIWLQSFSEYTCMCIVIVCQCVCVCV